MKSATRAVLALLVVGAVAAGGYVYWYGIPGSQGGEEQQAGEGEQPSRVTLAKAETADIVETVEVIGNVVAVDSVTLSARVTGRVQEVSFTDGQTVEEGQLLVQLDPAEARAAVTAAEARAEELQQSFARADELADRGAGPQATADDRQRQLEGAISQIESARERLLDYEIRAPFNGRLGLREISVGTLLQPGTAIVTIDTVDPIEVRFAVPERYLGRIAPDAVARVTTPAFADDEFEGRVSAISNRVDTALRTVEIEATVPNADARLLPGMLMDVRLELGTREDAVVVPPLAVRLQGDNHYVFAVEEGKAKRIDVQVGQREPERVEVTEGLEADQEIILEAPQDLASGQPVDTGEGGGDQAGGQDPAASPEG